jgi:hypothetical protein
LGLKVIDDWNFNALYQSGLIYGLLEQPEEKVSTLKRLIEQYTKSR